MTIYHMKTAKVSSFKPVTRRQPFVCRAADPRTQAYIIFQMEDPRGAETVDQVRDRLKGLDPEGTLCELCATGIERKS